MNRHVTAANWTLLTTLGLSGGLVSGLLIGMPLGQIVNAMITTAAVTCLVGGVLGSFQAFALRPILRRPSWWIVVTIVGLGIGLAAGVVLVEQTGILITGFRPNVARLGSLARALSFIGLGIVAGSILGIAQWLVLRKQAPRVKYWIAASAIGMAVAFCASSLLLDVSHVRIGSLPGVVIFVLASSAMLGLATSLPLTRRASTAG